MATRDILDYLGNVIGQLELPDDTTERQWQEQLAIYSQPPEPVNIPDVTPRQIRQALILSGITLSQIDDALNTLSEPTKSMAKIEWEYSIAFQRHRQLVESVGSMLGWTSDQLDNLWLLAGTL